MAVVVDVVIVVVVAVVAVVDGGRHVHSYFINVSTSSTEILL